MTNDRLWALSLIVCGTATALLAVNSFAGAGFPDAVVRICGILDLAGGCVLVFTSVRKFMKK